MPMTTLRPASSLSNFGRGSFFGLALVGGFVVLSGTGCVTQDVADRQQELLRDKNGQIVALEARLEEMQDRLSAAEANSGAAGDLLAVSAERDRLRSLLADANATIDDLASRPSVEMRMDPVVASALARLANANPNLMSYDAVRGVIQLQSDLTFGSGSIEVSPAAVSALNQLAAIFRSQEAAAYDVRIVGHTDNKPVRLLEGRRFNDNWELSLFRALAVKTVLTNAAVPDTRIEAAGRGEFVPVAQNSAEGAQANRRVEIFLVESASSAAAAAEAARAEAEAAAEAAARTPAQPAESVDAVEAAPGEFK